MSWIEVLCPTTPTDRDALEEWLTAHGALAITYAYADVLDPYLWEPDPSQAVLPEPAELIALFEDTPDFWEWLSYAKKENPHLQIRTRVLPDADWTRQCQKVFQAKQFGQRLWVCPSWDLSSPESGQVVLRLDPGIAFGTGSHPTTTLCLEVLESLSLEGKTVLDYGCGSGILSIAACLLGAERAWAVDHCEQALESTILNAHNNLLTEKIHACLPENLPHDFQADILCANILAEPLIRLAPTLRQHLRAGGTLILSGFLNTQTEALCAAYGLSSQSVAIRVLEDWAVLTTIV